MCFNKLQFILIDFDLHLNCASVISSFFGVYSLADHQPRQLTIVPIHNQFIYVFSCVSLLIAVEDQKINFWVILFDKVQQIQDVVAVFFQFHVFHKIVLLRIENGHLSVIFNPNVLIAKFVFLS